MTELSGTITQVTGGGQVAIHTSAGWIVSIESQVTFTAAGQQNHCDS